MIVEDFTMLGTTVPEPNSDGRVFVCSAGWSAELRQLIRVYPLARRGVPRRWHTYQIRLTRNSKDSRHESWQIGAERSLGCHDAINHEFAEVGVMGAESRRDALVKATVESTGEMTDRRLSLGIIHPLGVPELHFDYNPDSPDAPQLKLFKADDGDANGSRRFAFTPRLRFSDASGCHDLMLRDWGAFEYLRKYGNERRHEMSSALHMGSDSSLLVGNLNNQRSAYLVIAVLNGVREPALSLFDHALGNLETVTA